VLSRLSTALRFSNDVLGSMGHSVA